MICDTCIHKEVCYENEEDRKALKLCADYFNFAEELEGIKEKIKIKAENVDLLYKQTVTDIIDSHIKELNNEKEN